MHHLEPSSVSWIASWIRAGAQDFSIGAMREFEAATRLTARLCLLLVASFCVWTLDRGFDITDAAYYLLLAMHPGAVTLYISAQQWVSGMIWQLTGSLVAFRAAGMAMLVAGAAILSWGVLAAVPQMRGSHPELDARRREILLASSITCALVYVETIAFSPSYNLLATAGAYGAAGLVLLMMGRKPSERIALIALAGCMLAVEFVSKPSAGIATFALLALWVCLLGSDWRTIILSLAMLATSTLLVVSVLLVSNTSFADAQMDIREGLALFSMVQTEFVGDRLIRYAIEYMDRIRHGIQTYFILVTAVTAYLIIRRKLIVLLCIPALLYTLITIPYRLGYTGHYEAHFVAQSELGFVLLSMAMLVSMPAWRTAPRLMIVLAGLFLLPYTVGVGTGNALFTQVLATLAPWGAVVAILAGLHYNRRSDKAMVMVLTAGFISCYTLQTVTGVVRSPYHLVEPMLLQKFPVTVGRLGTVRVDAQTHAFVEDLQHAARHCAIAPDTSFLGLYNIPGVALILQAVPPVTPWLNNLEQAEVVLRRMPPSLADASTIAVLLDDKDQLPQLPSYLGPLDTRRRLCGASEFPLLIQQIQIWRPSPSAPPVGPAEPPARP